MAREAYRGDGQLKHSLECRMAFGRLDPERCARCEERQAERDQGIEARTHAGIEARRRNADEDARRSREIQRHDCKKERCGIVCTAFDW